MKYRITIDETTKEGMCVVNMFRSAMRFLKPNTIVHEGEDHLPPFEPSDDMPTTLEELLAQLAAKGGDFLRKAGFTMYTEDEQHLGISEEI